MSNLNELKHLENDLKKNEELRRKLEETCKNIKDGGKAKNDGEIMVAAAKELGYDISIAALEQAKAEAQELDLQEMQQITGGDDDLDRYTWCLGSYTCLYEYHSLAEDNDGHNHFCLAVWHCLTAALHTEGGTKTESCWKDYNCMLVNN